MAPWHNDAEHENLERLVVALEFRDGCTGGHARRVGLIAAALATAVGIRPPRADLFRLAAALHDIGKLGIPDAVLLKPAKLTAGDWEVMKRHTLIGWSILDPDVNPCGADQQSVFRLAAEIARSHHENWDGSGYPDGLRGEEIPVSARIVAVADVFDALVSARPYKAGWSAEAADAELLRCRGVKFEPDIVDAFLALRRSWAVTLPAEAALAGCPRTLAAA